MRFVLGLLVGLLAAGGYVGFDLWQANQSPCRKLCADGTECVEGRCEVVSADTKKRKRKRRRRRRRRYHRRIASANNPTIDDEPALKKASAADRRKQSKGPSLSGTDIVNLANAGGKELSRQVVESRFRRLDRKIIGCIDRARQGYDLGGGKVTVGFRIERSGSIKKVRLAAPALLMRRGLYGCVAPLVKGLRFRSSSHSLIMTYPYALD